MKCVFLSQGTISRLLESTAFEVMESFKDGACPSDHLVRDLAEICRAWLDPEAAKASAEPSAEPAPEPEPKPRRTLKFQEFALVDPPLPATFGQVSPPRAEQPAGQAAAVVDWPPKTATKAPAAQPDGEDLGEPGVQPKSLRISSEKALKALPYLSRGYGLAAEKSDLTFEEAQAIGLWLARAFNLPVMKAVRLPMDQKRLYVSEAAVGGWLEIPLGGKAA